MKAREWVLHLLLACAAAGSVACSAEREPPQTPPGAAADWLADGLPLIEASSPRPTCPSCTITLDSMFTIGNPTDTVFPADGLTHIVEGADHRFYVAPLSVEQKIGQYDRQGNLLAMFGGHDGGLAISRFDVRQPAVCVGTGRCAPIRTRGDKEGAVILIGSESGRHPLIGVALTSQP